MCWPIGKFGYGAIRGNPRIGVQSIALGSGFWIKRNGKGNNIGMPDEKNPMLRKKFELQDRDATLLLHVNSLGYHEIYLNGKKVSEDVLSPAVSQLNKRSLSVTYDLTSYAEQGTNVYGSGWAVVGTEKLL